MRELRGAATPTYYSLPHTHARTQQDHLTPTHSSHTPTLTLLINDNMIDALKPPPTPHYSKNKIEKKEWYKNIKEKNICVIIMYFIIN